jgi:protein gp37
VVNQAEADRDIPRLLALKGKLGIPWVGLSMEPLLGPVDLTAVKHDRYGEICALTGYIGTGMYGDYGPRLDWVIVGGESGPHARPMEDDWARDILAQCKAAGVPAFMKQMSKRRPIPEDLLIREYPANA